MQRTEIFIAQRNICEYHDELLNLLLTFIQLIMANTYTQFYVHLVFAVKNRNALIKKTWKNELEKYITGIVKNHKHKMLAIYAMPDHIHIFVGYNVNHLIPDLVEEIKTSSNHWIKKNEFSKFRFEWQKGYGAFHPFPSQIDTVIKICSESGNPS